MSVEAGVEAQDSANGVLFHNREMQCVASRTPSRSEDDTFCALRGNQVDLQYLINDSQDGVGCRLDGVAAVDRDLAMQDLLKDFCVGNEPNALA
jgi:hypothetical protein